MNISDIDIIIVVALAVIAILVLALSIYVHINRQNWPNKTIESQPTEQTALLSSTPPAPLNESLKHDSDAIMKLKIILEKGKVKLLHTNKGTKQINLKLTKDGTIQWSISDAFQKKIYSYSAGIDRFSHVLRGEKSPTLPSRPHINNELCISLIPKVPEHGTLHIQFPDQNERDVIYDGLTQLIKERGSLIV